MFSLVSIAPKTKTMINMFLHTYTNIFPNNKTSFQCQPYTKQADIYLIFTDCVIECSRLFWRSITVLFLKVITDMI